MKDWPPIKAWTSLIEIDGHRHFIAINYCIHEGIRWVNMVSVLNGGLCFQVKFEILCNRKVWRPGWETLENKELIKNLKNEQLSNYLLSSIKPSCFHPSEDSGLLITKSKQKSRNWFPDT